AGGPPEVVDEMALALWEAGLEVTVEGGRLVAVDPVAGSRCPVEVGDGVVLGGPVLRAGLLVVSLDDAVGLRVRDLHERGLAEDVADLAALAGLYSFRDLERLGRRHLPGFSLPELGMRLGFMCGPGREDGQARRFAAAWLEGLALRRAEDGDRSDAHTSELQSRAHLAHPHAFPLSLRDALPISWPRWRASTPSGISNGSAGATCPGSRCRSWACGWGSCAARGARTGRRAGSPPPGWRTWRCGGPRTA